MDLKKKKKLKQFGYVTFLLNLQDSLKKLVHLGNWNTESSIC